MPRWCLFGRTRELCDKLESTGKAGQAKVKILRIKFKVCTSNETSRNKIYPQKDSNFTNDNE